MQTGGDSCRTEPKIKIRKLELSDKSKGFVELLQQLSVCDSLSDKEFEERFNDLSYRGDEHVVCVIEDESLAKVIATGSVFIEKKFLRNCGKVAHIEDVVVDSAARGMQLGYEVHKVWKFFLGQMGNFTKKKSRSYLEFKKGRSTRKGNNRLNQSRPIYIYSNDDYDVIILKFMYAMVDFDQEEFEPTSSPIMFLKKKELMSDAMKRTSEWIPAQEIPSDITVKVGANTFTLHKSLLVAKCGYIRKLVSEADDAGLSVIEIPDVPGGSEAFELAGKFCYGINFVINTSNIAMLRCVSEYLEMSEEYAVGNLVERTEAYLKEVALNSLAGAISVLHQSENLLPMADKVKLLSRCIDTIAYTACEESQFCGPSKGKADGVTVTLLPKQVIDWWAEDLTVLRIDIFQKVLIAMMSRGFRQYALGPILMLYAQKTLRGLDIFGKGGKKHERRDEHEKRIIVETIVSLLPREKNAMSVSFLSMLLRAALCTETTVACRVDLEKRMGYQLGQAVLDDLLIPSFSFAGDTLFDIATVQRIISNYLECESDAVASYNPVKEYVSYSLSDMERIGKLMESYLAEIASDRNLSVPKFISVAELVPQQSRITDDGIYRAIDIYLKVHPELSDEEQKKVCSLMDCQKLSREACAHAAQNDRLPVQTVVQVLYYEQQRLRDGMNGNPMGTGTESSSRPSIQNPYSTDIHPVPEDFSSLKTENEGLKTEVMKMKMKLKEIEKPMSTANSNVSSPPINQLPSANKPPLPRKSFMNTVSKKLGRINLFDGLMTPKGRTKPAKGWRHSVS